jgi:hypothetical protein
MKWAIVIIFIIILIGYFFQSTIRSHTTPALETANQCPNVLIEKNSSFYLYNYNIPLDDNNPIVFKTLEEYADFVKREESLGRNCPVLYLQNSMNAQGEREYKIRPKPDDLNNGAPPVRVTKKTYTNMFKGTGLLNDATMDDKPYNVNSYPGFDSSDQQIGEKTPLDLMDLIQQTKEKSPNPQDPNWGGAQYTQELVDSDYYVENNVKLYVPL